MVGHLLGLFVLMVVRGGGSKPNPYKTVTVREETREDHIERDDQVAADVAVADLDVLDLGRLPRRVARVWVLDRLHADQLQLDGLDRRLRRLTIPGLRHEIRAIPALGYRIWRRRRRGLDLT